MLSKIGACKKHDDQSFFVGGVALFLLIWYHDKEVKILTNAHRFI